MLVRYDNPHARRAYETEVPCEADPLPFAKDLIREEDGRLTDAEVEDRLRWGDGGRGAASLMAFTSRDMIELTPLGAVRDELLRDFERWQAANPENIIGGVSWDPGVLIDELSLDDLAVSVPEAVR